VAEHWQTSFIVMISFNCGYTDTLCMGLLSLLSVNAKTSFAVWCNWVQAPKLVKYKWSIFWADTKKPCNLLY
jgi:hypothetical protein